MPKRIMRKRKRGWRMPPNTIYVGRPTLWGNPFQVLPSAGAKGSLRFRTAAKIALGSFACNDADQAVERYREWIAKPEQAELRTKATAELRGKNLACWCASGPCHADVLIELANGAA